MAERGRPRRTPVLLICLMLSSYFGYHLIKGKHGFEAQAALRARAVALEHQLADLEAMRTRLEHEVSLLSGPGIDRDSLEEAARSGLDFTRPGEVVVLER